MDHDRLRRLVEQREQLNNRIAKLAAAKQAQERRDETRRKIVAGAVLLRAVQDDRVAVKPTGVARWWDSQVAKLERAKDRDLFSAATESNNDAERQAPLAIEVRAYTSLRDGR